MKLKVSSIRNRRGSTYLTVIITTSVVGLMLAAYLKLVDVQNQLSVRSQTWNRTVPVVEAGIEEAMAHLNHNGSPDGGGNFDLSKLQSDGWSSGNVLNGPWYKQRLFDNDAYAVKIDAWDGNTNNFPKIYSTGVVDHLPAFALNKRFSAFLAGVSLQDMMATNSKYGRRVIECTTTNVPTFTKGLVTKRGIDMNGKNVETDSYNSLDENHSDGGRYPTNPAERLANGDVASNGQIINIGNAKIRGSVATGPFGTVNLGTGVVGDSGYVENPANAGTIQDGHFRDDMNVDFADVVLPPTCVGGLPTNCATWLPFPSTSGTTVIGTNTYRYVLETGDYDVSGMTLSESVYARGNVRLLVRSSAGINITGNDRITVGTNGSLKIYADCPTVNLGGNGVVNETGSAIKFAYYGTARNTSISLGGNAEFVGTIYAPYAHLELNGGGGAINDFSGAAMVASAKFNGHFRFHYDEALPAIGAWRGFTVTSWNEK